MDLKTLETYNKLAAKYSDDWLSQPAPIEIHEIVRAHFKKGAPTVDIGCGSGRDVAWLNNEGYPCLGYDGSDGLLSEARKRFPQFQFLKSLLPKLTEIPDGSYDNVACETVMMHLPEGEQLEAFQNLLRVVKPGGVLHLSWRFPEIDHEASRDENHRLYAPVNAQALIDYASQVNAEILEYKTALSASTGRKISHLVLKTKFT